MGISTTVGRASDAQIRDLSEDPQAADDHFAGCASGASTEFCHLHDHWAGLHFLLAGDVEGGELPLAAIRRGDLVYIGVSDPIHAIYSATTRAFAEALANLVLGAVFLSTPPEF